MAEKSAFTWRNQVSLIPYPGYRNQVARLHVSEIRLQKKTDRNLFTEPHVNTLLGPPGWGAGRLVSDQPLCPWRCGQEAAPLPEADAAVVVPERPALLPRLL